MKRLKRLMKKGVRHGSFVTGESEGLLVCFYSIFRLATRPFVLSMGLALLGAIQSPAQNAGVSDLIWVETNSTAGNVILTFRNNGTGTPTFVGSTPAGGIGVFDKTFALGPFDSDQNLIVNPEGTLLFAVNSGSNTIAVFHITATGLEPVEGSPFPSGGSDPV